MTLIEKAVEFANNAHMGQKRKLNNLEYILHPLEVGIIISTITKDENVIAAGILHDVVEDCNISLETIKEEFGQRVYELVAFDTENRAEDHKDSSDTWTPSKKDSIDKLVKYGDYDAKTLWLADKLSNMRSIYLHYQFLGDNVWQQFNQKDKEKQRWYYFTILEILDIFRETVAYRELERMIKEVFKD